MLRWEYIEIEDLRALYNGGGKSEAFRMEPYLYGRLRRSNTNISIR
jgi:hypothetical protein